MLWSRLRDYLSTFDLRFPDPRMELTYKQGLETELLETVRLAAAVGWATTVALLLAILHRELNSPPTGVYQPYRWELSDARTNVFSTWAIAGVIFFLYGIAAHCGLHHRWIRAYVDWEVSCMLFFAFAVVMALAGSLRLQPALVGQDPEYLWYDHRRSGGSIGWLLLDVLMSSCCLLTPIRCHMVWTVPATVIALFTMSSIAIDVGYGHFTVTNILNLYVMGILGWYAVLGAWRRESHEREKFIALRTQEQLRFEKEATASLLRMTCDSAIWIGPDGDTVLESDRWLDYTMEREMVGECFSDCFGEMSQDLHEIRRIMHSARRGSGSVPPVSLLPLRLSIPHGRTINTDLFIVDRTQAPIARVTETMGYLVGIRCRGSENICYSPLEPRRLPPNQDTVVRIPDRMEAGNGAAVPQPDVVDGDAPHVQAARPVAEQHHNLLGGCEDGEANLPETTICLPADAEMLLCKASNQVAPIAVANLVAGQLVYCLTGRLGEPNICSCVVESVKERRGCDFFRLTFSEPGRSQRHDVHLAGSSSLLMRTSRKKFVPVAASKLGPSEANTVVHVESNTADAGTAPGRFCVHSIDSSSKPKDAVIVSLKFPCIGTFVRNGPTLTELADRPPSDNLRPFFAIALASREVPEIQRSEVTSEGTSAAYERIWEEWDSDDKESLATISATAILATTRAAKVTAHCRGLMQL
eukprot:TRINITY_DN68739_c0_g1_i1.p1 TRINITY_DN68739_c0_g1~~TRINITY_DN68739_c0_g1_i1.p1  ORF type:complete len:698 (-),score=71.47 TRINITY_DN68739_c0_g1_i1:403-2496(-)